MRYLLLFICIVTLSFGQDVYVRSGNGKTKINNVTIVGGNISIPATLTIQGPIARKPNLHYGANGLYYQAGDTAGGSIDTTSLSNRINAKADPDTLDRKREMQYLKNAGAATGTNLGFAAAPTLSGVLLSADDTRGPYLKHSTNTTANNVGGVTSAFTIVRGDWMPEMHTRIQMDTSANTDAVWWAGLFSAAPDSNGRPNTRVAAFRYHTKWDQTAYWRCVTIDGTGTTNETTVTSVATAINTPYNFSIFLTTTGTRFYINGVLVATHTSVIPGSTTLLGYVVRCANLSTAKHNVRWSRISIRHL